MSEFLRLALRTFPIGFGVLCGVGWHNRKKGAGCRGLKSGGDIVANRISFSKKDPIIVTMH